MFRKLAVCVTALATLFSADAVFNDKMAHASHMVNRNTKARKVKSFSVCVSAGDGRRLGETEEDRTLKGGAGSGTGYFSFLSFADDQYATATIFDCDTGDDLGVLTLYCQGEYGYAYGEGEISRNDCEFNIVLPGEPGSSLILHTSYDDDLGYTVTTLGASGKFYKSEVVDMGIFIEEIVRGPPTIGLSLYYKTSGYNPLFWKDN